MKQFLLCILLSIGIGVPHLLVHAERFDHDIRELTPAEKQTFDALKKKFLVDLLDAELKTLHQLIESTEYKDFLTKTYPDAKLPPYFAEALSSDKHMLYKIQPPKERYQTYYTQHFGVQNLDAVTETEHFLVHYEITNKWIFTAIKRSGDTPEYLRPKGPLRGGPLHIAPPFTEMMNHRFNTELTAQFDPATYSSIFRNFSQPLSPVTDAVFAADVRWIQALFEKHSRSDSLLYIALQQPALLSRIRAAFTTDKTFLKFVYAPHEW